MKKLNLVVLFVFSITWAQNEKIVGDFNKVTVFDKITVKLVPANEYKIVYKGKFENDVETILSNNELKIRLPLGNFLKGEELLATVYYKNLEGLEANEGSFISSESDVNTLNLNIIAKEGGEVRISLKNQQTTIKASQGAIVTVSGISESLNATTHTGAKVSAEKLTVKNAVLVANTGAMIDCFVTDFVDAKARTGSEILIFGNPKSKKTKNTLGGSVFVRN